MVICQRGQKVGLGVAKAFLVCFCFVFFFLLFLSRYFTILISASQISYKVHFNVMITDAHCQPLLKKTQLTFKVDKILKCYNASVIGLNSVIVFF